MVQRKFLFLLISSAGGVLGAFLGSLVSYWLHPLLQYDLSMFLSDLFSFGRLASAVFVWLFYAPALIILIILSKRFMGASSSDWSYVYVLMISLLLVFISQIHPFGRFFSGIPEYLMNTALSGLILIGPMVVLRRQRNG